MKFWPLKVARGEELPNFHMTDRHAQSLIASIIFIYTTILHPPILASKIHN